MNQGFGPGGVSFRNAGDKATLGLKDYRAEFAWCFIYPLVMYVSSGNFF
jgi:hypothetical protein